MSEYNIEKTNFEKQKNELKSFAEQPATSTKLDKFSTNGKWSDFLSGGLPGLLSGHKVTGDEINSLVTELQSCFAEINERDRRVIKEFGQVYETFEALDKGYIQGILIGLKSAEKASQEAKDAQKDVDDTIKALQKTISKLKEFKDEVNGYTHLKDIDKIWNDILQLDRELKRVSQKLKEQETSLTQKISELSQFRIKIEKYKHINDIDDMWDTIKGSSEKIESISKELKTLSKNLTTKTKEMITFKNDLEKSEHIKDVDIMWNKLLFCMSDLDEYATSQKRMEEKLSEIDQFILQVKDIAHIDDIDDEWEYSHSIGEDIQKTVIRVSDAEDKISGCEERIQFYENENSQMKQRINIAYIVAGGALGISIIQIVLQFMGVL